MTYRYGRGSTQITTNKKARDWPELLAGNAVLSAAILDRLQPVACHRCPDSPPRHETRS